MHDKSDTGLQSRGQAHTLNVGAVDCHIRFIWKNKMNIFQHGGDCERFPPRISPQGPKNDHNILRTL